MICPECKEPGNNVTFGHVGIHVFIKMTCKNKHYFGRTRVMTHQEMKKLLPFKSWNDVKKKIFKTE